MTQSFSSRTTKLLVDPERTGGPRRFIDYSELSISEKTDVASGATPAATVPSLTDTVYIPELNLSSTSGLPGTPTTLSGAYYVPKTPYNYCLSTSSNSISCVSGTGSTFMSSNAGTIPSGVSLTIPTWTANGAFYVIAYSRTTVVPSLSFKVT